MASTCCRCLFRLCAAVWRAMNKSGRCRALRSPRFFRKTGSAIRPLSQAPAPFSSGLACDALVWASPLQVEPQFSGRLHRPVEHCSVLRRPKWLFLQPSSWACGQVLFSPAPTHPPSMSPLRPEQDDCLALQQPVVALSWQGRIEAGLFLAHAWAVAFLACLPGQGFCLSDRPLFVPRHVPEAYLVPSSP